MMVSTATCAPLLNIKGSSTELLQDHHNLSLLEVIMEIKRLYTLAFPMIITGLLVYTKSFISMLFLGKLGKDVLAGGSLAIGIANITGYSVVSGLALGMEAIASQAFGAKQLPLMAQTLHRTVITLLFACIPVSLLWLNIKPILIIFFHQDPNISSIASNYLTFCIPDLFFQSFINPIKIYLRSQNITSPLIQSAAFAVVLHAPLNYFVVYNLSLGVRGVAFAVVLTDFVLLLSLLLYLCRKFEFQIMKLVFQVQFFDQEWKSVLNLAIPSCFSVCLEWWWYELMILLSGVLSNAAEAIAAMGILLQATSLIYIFPSALGLAAATRVGNELGASRPGKARVVSNAALICAVVTSAVATASVMAMGGRWGAAFTEDEAIVALTSVVMPVVGMCELGNCPQTTGCGVLRGSARPNVGANINLAAFYGVGLPLAVVIGVVMEKGVVGLWLGLLGAQIVCAVVMVWVLVRTDWVEQVQRARELIGPGVTDQDSGELIGVS